MDLEENYAPNVGPLDLGKKSTTYLLSFITYLLSMFFQH